MTNRDSSVYAENRSYLESLKQQYNIMDDGAAFQFADTITRSSAIIEPASAFQSYIDAVGLDNDLRSFARLCKYLPASYDSEV